MLLEGVVGGSGVVNTRVVVRAVVVVILLLGTGRGRFTVVEGRLVRLLSVETSRLLPVETGRAIDVVLVEDGTRPFWLFFDEEGRRFELFLKFNED